MTKLEKIEQEAQKAREKIAAMQTRLKEIDGQRTEQENLQIVQQVRALKLTRDELYAFINGGALPGTLAGAVDGTGSDNAADADTDPDAADPNADTPSDLYSELSYLRHGKNKNRRHEPDSATEPEADMPNTDENPYTTTNYESEGMNHEE